MKLLSRFKIDNDQFLHIIIFLLCFIPIAISILLSTDGKSTSLQIPGFEFGIGVPCFFKAMTQYNCPACGMTRCFIYMSKLKLDLAWIMNRAGVLLYLFCLLQVPYRVLLVFKVKIPFLKYIMWFEAIFLVTIGILDMWDFIFQFFI